MSIHSAHPSVLEFKENEVHTLTYLRNWKLVRDFSRLDDQILYAKSNYADPKKIAHLDFEFHADFPISIEGSEHQVFIEAKIAGDYKEATYLLAITDKDKPLELIRKFHFDFAHPSNPTNQSVPIFHLQYGGKMTPYMIDARLVDTKIDHWLSLPRLIYSPINLALLLDMAFSELGTEQTRKIVEKPEWRGLIWNNEKFILKKYYEGIAKFCSSQAYNSKNLIRDFCYGRSKEIPLQVASRK